MDLPPQLPTNADDVISALQSLTAASAHLHFSIAGQKHDAISFEGSEAISTLSSATLYVLAELDSAWLGQPGMVTVTDASGNERTLAGIVTYQRERGLNAKKQSRVEVKLQPRLCLLTRTTDNRFSKHCPSEMSAKDLFCSSSFRVVLGFFPVSRIS